MKRYLLPLAWMGFIFTLSTDIGSMGNTSRFLVPLIRWIVPTISQSDLSTALFIIRKSAHFFEYAILSILWYSVFIQGGERVSRHPVLMAVLISVSYAGLDEIHHGLLESRTGSFVDVGIDTLGAITGVSLWSAIKNGLTPAIKLKLRYFGWWFSWGFFSTIMALIVLRGGSLSPLQMLLSIPAVATATGIGGLVYYARNR